MFQIFGNELILEKEIDIECPVDILYEIFDDVIYKDNLTFVKEFRQMIRNLQAEEKRWGYYSWLDNLLHVEALVTNHYDGEDIEVPAPDERLIQVQNGCKTMRMLGKLANAFNLLGFEEFRLKHSMVLNQKRFKGTLCISIHPLDYMTMSDNACDWDSCMNWRDGGEYRMGTIECMNSPYIIVAYLRQTNAAIIFDDAKWNSKRWRQLFICTPELLTAIKGYPFQDTNLRDLTFDWILELVDKNIDYNYYKESGLFCNSIENKIPGCDTLKYVNLYFNVMYNDIRGNNKIYYGPKALDKSLAINLSGPTECVCCGGVVDWGDCDPAMLICWDCSGLRRCPECGEIVYEDDLIELMNGEMVCCNCIHECGKCACCDGDDKLHNLHTVNLIHKGALMPGCAINICPACLTSNDFVDECGKPLICRRPYLSNGEFEVQSKNLTDAGYEMFNIWGLKRKEMQEENKKSKRFWFF